MDIELKKFLAHQKFSVSLHFRSVKTEDIKLVKKVFHNVVQNYSKNNLFTIMKGKKVLEVLSDVSWDKGKAVLWVLHQLKDRCLPVYAGDDRTDEDAFKALRGKGITNTYREIKKYLRRLLSQRSLGASKVTAANTGFYKDN